MRLFIGIAIPPSVGDVLVSAAAALPLAPTWQAVPAENLHVTLAFLGEREESAVPELAAILRESARETPVFPLSVTGFGCFPKARVLYASLEYSAELNSLATRLRRRLSLAGESFAGEPFTPHVTLARKVRLEAPPQTTAAFSEVFTARSITLYHSTRLEGKLTYLPLYSAAFAVAAISTAVP